MYAKVIVEIGVKNVDRMFTYIIPKSIKEDIKIGSRVKVGFGSRIIEGFVLEIDNTFEGNYELKEIISLVDKEPILNEEMLYLGKCIANTTLCSLISAYQVMLPKALKAKNNTSKNKKEKKTISLNKDNVEIDNYISKCRYNNQIEILNYLKENRKMDISKMTSAINTLIKKELIKLVFEEEYRYKISESGKYKVVNLTNEQQKVV